MRLACQSTKRSPSRGPFWRHALWCQYLVTEREIVEKLTSMQAASKAKGSFSWGSVGEEEDRGPVGEEEDLGAVGVSEDIFLVGIFELILWREERQLVAR